MTFHSVPNREKERAKPAFSELVAENTGRPRPFCKLPAAAALPSAEGRVLRVLAGCVGQNRAVSLRELPARAGIFKKSSNLPDPDTARKAIASLIRKYGVPVCSSSSRTRGGYWLPETREELERCRAMVRNYIADLRTREMAYDKILIEQQELFDPTAPASAGGT